MTTKRNSIDTMRFSTPDFRKFSNILEEVVYDIVKREVYEVKYQEIFIDINNKLFEIFQTEDHRKYPIFCIMNKFHEKIILLRSCVSPTDFMNLCIHFAFMSHNLNSLFPNGIIVEDIVLDEPRAEEWWRKNFDNAIFIGSEEFWNGFSRQFPNLKDRNCILKSICFTQNDWYSFINKDNFNLFLRFYGGWDNLENFWLEIYHHPGISHMSTLETCKHELERVQTTLKNLRTISRSYLFCINWRSVEGLWNLVYGDENANIKVTLVRSTELIATLNERKYKYPKGMDLPPNRRLSRCNIRAGSIPALPIPNQVVSSEIYETLDSLTFSNDERHEMSTLNSTDTTYAVMVDPMNEAVLSNGTNNTENI